MPRKRANSTKSAPPTPALTGGAKPLPALPLAVLAGLILLELWLYYSDAPELHIKQRISSLVFLTAPDELFSMWCGGKIANFSLFDRWPIVLLTVVVLFGSWLAGRLALSTIGITQLLTRLEQHTFALAV